MPEANSYFKNAYTFEIRGDLASDYQSLLPALEANAIEVIEYVSDFVQWNGTLDFVLQFDGPVRYGPNGFFEYAVGDGLLPSFGGIEGNRTWAQYEAATGMDPNGSEPDTGAYILPNVDGTLSNRGAPLYIDPTPDAYEQPSLPAGQHDFFSIYLHEVLHSFGIWSTGQYEGFSNTAFDDLAVERSGVFWYEGAAVVSLLGQGVPLDEGSRGHFEMSWTDARSPIDSTVMGALGAYEQNRWHLGQFELAVLEDLGFTVANAELLPITHTADAAYVGIAPGSTPSEPDADEVFAVADALSVEALSYLRDFDGNSLGATDQWQEIGRIDVTKDGDTEIVISNAALGRWATLGITPDETVDFRLFGEGGDTRVVGTYQDPLVSSGEVVAGSAEDSQVRFANDLKIGNIGSVLDSDDYDNDGINELYVGLADGSAVLRMLMHDDGNIRYANYQSQMDLDSYMVLANVAPSVYQDWI